MGCSESTSQTANSLKPAFTKAASSEAIRDQIFLLGALNKGPVIIRYSPGNIESVMAPIKFPKYAHAFVNEEGIGFMSGGVEELQLTSAELKSLEEREYEGEISKRFIKVDTRQLLSSPSTAFEEMPPMINARYAHCAIQLGSDVYAIGGREYGDDEVGILSACQKFDLTTGKWSSIPSLQYPRAGACTVLYGQLIYVFGGYTGKNERSRVIECYSKGDSSWKKLPYRLHQGIEGALVLPNVQSGTSIYVFGGKTNDEKVVDVVQINFAKCTVQKCEKMKQKRCFHKGYIIDKKVHIIGGGTDTIEIYDFQKGESVLEQQLSFLEHCSTKQLAALSALQPQITLKEKKITYESPTYPAKAYLLGHSKEPFMKVMDMDRMIILSEGQNLAHNFYQYSTVIQVNKETTFVMGGINPNFTELTDQVYSFNLKTEEVKYLQPLKIAKYGFSAVVKGSFLYIAGGRKLGGDDVAILSSCERFSFENYSWESIGPLKNKRHSATMVVAGNFPMIIGGYKGNGYRLNETEVFIEGENRWAEIDQKFELAAESMAPVVYKDEIYIFGGRAEQIDIQKVFKLNITIDQGIKYEKAIKTSLQPVGNLSVAGTNLKVFVNKQKGMAYIFGNIKNGIDVYDLKKNKIVQSETLSVFMHLKDPLFQTYTILF